MPADRAVCSQLLRRFPKLPFADEAFTELVDALSRNAADTRHALDAVTAILEAWTSDMACPTAADIRRVLYERRPETTVPRCPKCHGIGYVSRDIERAGQRISVAAPCECRPKSPAPAAEKPKKRQSKLDQFDSKSAAAGDAA